MWAMTMVALGGTRANAKRRSNGVHTLRRLEPMVGKLCEASWHWSEEFDSDSHRDPANDICPDRQNSQAKREATDEHGKCDGTGRETGRAPRKDAFCGIFHKPLVSDSRRTPLAENIAKQNVVILELVSQLRMRICGLEQSIVFAIVIATANS